MLASLTITDRDSAEVFLHGDGLGKRALTKAVGLQGIPPVRQTVRPWPTRHGSIDESHLTDGSLVVLEGLVKSTAGLEDMYAEFRAIAKPLLETLDNAPAILRWTEGDTGLQLQKTVKLAGDVQPELGPGRVPLLRYQAQLRAEDPRAYSQAQSVITGAALSAAAGGLTIPFLIPFTFNESSGGEATVTNNGNRPTPPVFRIYGQVTSPSILLVGSSPTKQIAFTGSVGAGDYLEVDVANRTVLLNGTTNRINLLNFASTTWYELPVGTSTIQLQGTNFDGTARVDVYKRDAYT